MRIQPLRCALVFTLFVTVPAPALAQNLVRGTVKDNETAKPVEGANVHFEGVDFVAKRDVKTDKKGEYFFQGLQSGPYKVTASKDGVGIHVRNYEVSAMSAKERLDFFLVSDRPVVTTKETAAAPAPKTAPPAGLESLAVDAAAVAKGRELAELQTLAKAAVEAQNAGKHDDAIAKFSELTGKVPECSDCFVRLGASYYEVKRVDEALTAYNKSISLRPSVEAYTALAKIYNSQRKYDEARDATEKAAELADKLLAGPSAGGAAPGAPGVVQTGNASSETLFNRGVVLWNSGKFAEAKTQFEAAVKVNPNNADAQYQLGMANLNLGQIPAARAAFEAYLKAAPTGPKAGDVKGFLNQLPK